MVIMDLEMNQPSDNIFSIGAVALDFRDQKNQIRSTFSGFCRLPDDDPLNPEIATLCKVTQEQLNKLCGFEQLTTDFWAWFESTKSGSNIGAWGGDVKWLVGQCQRRVQINPPVGLRVFNLKDISQIFRSATGMKSRGGLKNTLDHFGIPFVGTQHQAVDDAVSTGMLALEMFHIIKNYWNIRKLANTPSIGAKRCL